MTEKININSFYSDPTYFKENIKSQKMKKTLNFITACSFTLTASNAQSFNWDIFIPAITGMKPCSIDDLSGCRTANECDKIDRYWYEYKCNAAKHPNQLKVEQMAGSWRFVYQYGWEWQDRYLFDLHTVGRWPPYDDSEGLEEWEENWKNAYVIWGINENGEEVNTVYTTMKVHYNPIESNNYYSGNDRYGSVTKHYVFGFVNDNELSGIFFNIAAENWEKNPYPMKGYRIQTQTAK